ncbi:hypothetical protein AKJ16_DCAP19715 [Drosera capensis]
MGRERIFIMGRGKAHGANHAYKKTKHDRTATATAPVTEPQTKHDRRQLRLDLRNAVRATMVSR